MGLERYQRINLGFLVGGGVLLAASSIGFRVLVERKTFDIPAWVFEFQYVAAIVVLGILLILLWQSNSEVANYAYAVMTFAFGVGVLFPPAPMSSTEIARSAALLPLVVGGGVYYYRYNDATNTLFIGLFTLFAHEIYLFGVTYTVLAWRTLEQPLFLAGVFVLSVILYGLRQILVDELDKTKDRSRSARALALALEPTRVGRPD